jgi:hypothetical protein
VFVQVSSMNTSRAGSNMPCSRIQRRRARTTSARFCSVAYRVFLKLMLRRAKNRHTALRLPAILRLRIAATISSSVMSGSSAVSASRNSACFSNGEMLPPLGLAATLPVSSKRCTQITTTLVDRI